METSSCTTQQKLWVTWGPSEVGSSTGTKQWEPMLFPGK